MDCRHVTFSPEKSQERIHKALQIFPRKLLMHILAFALHLLGASRKEVAALVEMPQESVKTLLRVVLRDGFPALRDRRLLRRRQVRRRSSSATIRKDGQSNSVLRRKRCASPPLTRFKHAPWCCRC